MLNLIRFSRAVTIPLGVLGSRAAFSSKPPLKVAVVLSGSGVFDGSEITEAVACLVHLCKENAVPVCYAPDIEQMHVVDHQKLTATDKDKDCRKVLSESAQISRGNITPLNELCVDSVDAVVFPGGFGVAKNLSNFAKKGAECQVDPEVARVIEDFHAAKKPLAFCCIAPILAARLIRGVKITLGKCDDGSGRWPHGLDAIDAADDMGAILEPKEVYEVCIDEKNRVVSTPAYMYEGRYNEIFAGIGCMIENLMKMVGKC